MKLRAVIYCRISNLKQAREGDGLTSQETRCRQYAEAKDYDVVTVFPVTITGGGDFMKRPGMVALLAFLDAHPDEQFVVIFVDLKRYSRDVEFHLKLKREMDARNAVRECLNFNFMDTPEGEFHEIMIAATGQLERKQNARQTRQKMKARMQNGYFVHRCSVGFKYVAVKGRGKMLVPDAPWDSVIREAFEGYASGRFGSQAEVKRFFESTPNFPRLQKGKLTHQRVIDILTQPVYAGYICSDTYDIQWLKAQHEPLISLDTFQKVQDRRNGVAKTPKRANIGDKFALRGIVCCSGCDVPLRSSFTRGNGGHRAYYLCQTKTCEHYGKSIKRDTLEADVGEVIKELQPAPDLMAMAAAMFRKVWDTRRDQAASVKRDAEFEVRRLDKEIDKLVDLIMTSSNGTARKRFESKIAELEMNKALMAEKAAQHTEPTVSFDEKLEPALTFLANPWKLWQF